MRRPERKTVRLPAARGPLSNFVIEHLRRAPHKLPGLLAPVDDPLRGDDFHLALLIAFRVQAGTIEVSDGWQWNASLIDFRVGLQRRFESALTMSSDPVASSAGASMGTIAQTIAKGTIQQDRAHTPAAMISRIGSPAQLEELLAHRALLLETVADAWALLVPRVPETDRDALVRFGMTVSKKATHAADLPGVSLARANLIWLLAIDGSHGVALAGALAVHEMLAARADHDLAVAARRLRLPEVATELETAAERASEGNASTLAASLSSEQPGAAAVAKGARWMLAVTRRWSSATMAGATGRSNAARGGVGAPIRSA